MWVVLLFIIFIIKYECELVNGIWSSLPRIILVKMKDRQIFGDE